MTLCYYNLQQIIFRICTTKWLRGCPIQVLLLHYLKKSLVHCYRIVYVAPHPSSLYFLGDWHCTLIVVYYSQEYICILVMFHWRGDLAGCIHSPCLAPDSTHHQRGRHFLSFKNVRNTLMNSWALQKVTCFYVSVSLQHFFLLHSELKCSLSW
jgi:hypothetical protein